MTIRMGTGTIPMLERPHIAIQRLVAWMSPAFPVGAFAYSSGLETAISTGSVHNASTLSDWILGNLTSGQAHTDGILLAASHAADAPENLQEIADIATALTTSRERLAELNTIGEAFVAAANAWITDLDLGLPQPCPYPVTVGAIARATGVNARDTLAAFFTAYAQTQISVAVRLVPLGQTDGLKVLASLEGTITSAADRLAGATLDQLGGIAYGADIAAMAHETLRVRVFRS